MERRVEDQLMLHLEVLRRAIRERGWSLPELEARLGREPGALEARFRRPRDLDFDDLFEILEAIGVEPEGYFAEVAREIEQHESGRRSGAGCLLAGAWDRQLPAAVRRAVRSLLHRTLPGRDG